MTDGRHTGGDDDPTIQELLDEEDREVAAGRIKPRHLVVAKDERPFGCPQCGSLPNEWRQEGDQFICNRDDTVVMTEICPVERDHCPECGSAENFVPGDNFSTCHNLVAVKQKNCTTWRNHDEKNR